MSRIKLPVVKGFFWFRCLHCGFLFFRLAGGTDHACPVCNGTNLKRVNGWF